MVANIRGYTPNYGLKLINFDTPRWHTLEYSNWELVDAIMASTGLPGLRGEWINSTSYVAGERVFDSADGKIYGCLVTHTSAATGTFAQDRAAHPTYWMLQTLDTPRYRGGWAPSVAYSVADIVFVNSYTYYICIANHTSGTTFPPDASKWSVVFDATAAVNTTNANAAAAANSASQASTSASSASTSATNAQASAVESAAQAAKLYGTSTSSVTVGVGGRSFETQAGKYFNVGKFIMVRADADPVNQWMWGQVTSYSGTSLVINAITSGGSGTYAAWTIDVSGSRGAIGPQGPQGELGPPLVIKGTVPTASALPPTGNTIGDMYIATDNGHLYIWDGTMWDDAGPLGTSTTTTADIPPSNPKDGDMWWESDSGIFWVYYDDGNTSQWVQAGGAAASINQNAVLKTGDTMTGDLVFNYPSPTIKMSRFAGSENVSILGMQSGLNLWQLVLGDTNNGNVSLHNFNDAGLYVGAPLTIARATGRMELSSPLTVGSTSLGAPLNAPWAGTIVGQPICPIQHLAFNSYLSDSPTTAWRVLKDGPLAQIYVDATGINFVPYPTSGTAGALAPTPAAGAFVRIGPTGVVNVATATPSSSPTTGALTVAGGLGVGGAIWSSTLQVGNAATMPVIGTTMVRIAYTDAWGLAFRPTIDASGAIAFHNAANTIVGTITTTASATAYNTSSDASLKEDLKSFDAGSIIDNTNVYDFAWKSTKERAFGVIAQQAVDVYPQAITHTEADAESKRDEWWGVDYSKYVPVLLQELKALRQRVADLEGRTLDKPVVTTAPRGRK